MRKVGTVTIGPDGGRDAGKTYVLTEMPATKAEKWAARALLAMSKAGVEVPEGAGMEAVAGLGLNMLGNMSFEDAEILMDEMMQCVTIQPDPQKNPNFTRPLLEEDIEEVQTRFKLRMEIFALHTGFSMPGSQSTLTMMAPGQAFYPIQMSRAR